MIIYLSDYRRSTPLRAPTDAEIEAALVRLCEAAEENERRLTAERELEPSEPGRFETINVADLCETPEPVVELRDWVADPVRMALREAAGRIGKLVARRDGHLDGLGELLERVADRASSPLAASARGSFLDHAFDGISVNGRLWAA